MFRPNKKHNCYRHDDKVNKFLYFVVNRSNEQYHLFLFLNILHSVSFYRVSLTFVPITNNYNYCDQNVSAYGFPF